MLKVIVEYDPGTKTCTVESPRGAEYALVAEALAQAQLGIIVRHLRRGSNGSDGAGLITPQLRLR